MWTLFLAPFAMAADGTVTMPLPDWVALQEALSAEAAVSAPPEPVLFQDRTVEGSLRRGVFSGTLSSRFEVPAGAAPLRVPVLDAAASVASVELDGRRTSLLEEGGLYTVAVDSPGVHSLRVGFFQGREDDRFARRLSFNLPGGGPTAISIQVPEAGIEATLSHGAITALVPEAGGTRIRGQLDATGALDLAWKGHTEQAAAPVRTEARVAALFTLHEALVRGLLVVDTTVLDGEADRVRLTLPEGVEVVDVTGEAVLQWQTEAGPPGGGGELVVLLRYLVIDHVPLRVHFQFPVELDQGITLRMPTPPAGTPWTGSLGVEGPAGLEAKVVSAEGVTPLRDLPRELSDISENPLLLSYRFEAPPQIALAVHRQAEVELSSTVVDDLEASTVLDEGGAEITKMQLRLRNRTRQYLGLSLPEGAVLTHALIDGRPVRPAVSPDDPNGLLFPLVQSERFTEGQTQTWEVQPGDTLGGIADRFFSDPGRWDAILQANPDQLSHAFDLAPGQVLRIPTEPGLSVQESSFVVELAYTRQGEALGGLGRRALRLPAVDVDVVEATWHVYLPDSIEPLDFSANLSQYSDIRYDHIRRLRTFLRDALLIRSAWAGGDGYTNILARRKAIYREENLHESGGQEAASAFPLIGDRYRFKRILLGREAPAMVVTWVRRSVLPALRVGALLGAFGLVFGLLRGKIGRGAVAAGMMALLGLAWFVLGVHRRILWGVDLALLVALAVEQGPGLLALGRRRLQSARSLLGLLSGRSLLLGLGLLFFVWVLLMVPLLWSTLALVALTRQWRRRA